MSIVAKGAGPVNPAAVLVQKAESDALPNLLRVALANQVTYYLTAHGFHWNVQGEDFGQYHELFEQIYSDAYEAIDPLAECLRKIIQPAPYAMTDYIALRNIPEVNTPSTDPANMASSLLMLTNGVISHLTASFDSATMAGEQGVANFLAERIDMTQKWAWQLRASLTRDQPTAQP